MELRIGLLVLFFWCTAAFGVGVQEGTGQLTGEVFDVTAQIPLAGVRLELSPIRQSTFTNEAGQFVFNSVKPGTYVLRGEKVGYATLRRKEQTIPGSEGITLNVGPGPLMLSLRMAPAALLSGRILNDRGQPLQDLRVTPFRWVYDESGGLEPKYFAAEKTNDLGEFRFNNLDEAEYRFRVESPLVVKDPGAYAAGYIPGVMNARDAPSWELHSGTEIRLPDTVLPRSLGERFVLKLVNNTGLTVTGPISINLRRQGDIAPTSAQTVVLTPEQEEIGPLAPGNYDVGVIVNVPGGRLRGSRSVQVPSGQTELNIEVFRNVRLRGSVQATANSGAEVPVGGVRVRLVEQGAFQDVPLSFQSNSDGALAISFVAANGVFPGSFKVKIDRVPANLYVDAVRVGGKDILDGELVVRSDDDLDVRVMLREAPVHIIGRVTNAQGRPTVVVLVPDRENGVPLFRTTLADDRDQFELWTVKGKYRLYAFSELEGAAYRDASFIEKVFAQGTPVDASIEREFSVDVRVLP